MRLLRIILFYTLTFVKIVNYCYYKLYYVSGIKIYKTTCGNAQLRTWMSIWVQMQWSSLQSDHTACWPYKSTQ